MSAFFARVASAIGASIAKWGLTALVNYLLNLWASVKKASEQKKIDEENAQKYEKVKTGELSNEEDASITEDALSGRKPRGSK